MEPPDAHDQLANLTERFGRRAQDLASAMAAAEAEQEVTAYRHVPVGDLAALSVATYRLEKRANLLQQQTMVLMQMVPPLLQYLLARERETDGHLMTVVQTLNDQMDLIQSLRVRLFGR